MASGLTDTDQMAKDLRTVAGAAAMTGRSYENMGQIFAAVAGQGKLMGDQLLQFSSSGVNAASTIAKYLNTTEANVRDMVSKGKIDFRTFADAMESAFAESAGRADETFAGVTSNVRAQLSRIGQVFAEPYIKNMIPLLQKVKAALKQFKNALVPTGERFDYIFGRLTNWAAGVVESLDFSRLDTIIRGVENIFWGLASVLYTVHEAFEEVFTRKTLEELNNSAIAFEKFTKAILPTKEVLNGVKTVSKGVMIALSAIVNVAVKLTDVIKALAFAVIRILGAVVSLTRHFQPIMDHLAELVKESKVLEAIGLIISDIVLKLTDLIIGFLDVIDGLIGRFMELDVIKEFGNTLIDIYKVLSTLFIVVITLLGAAIGKLLGYLNIDSLAKIWSKFAGILKTIGSFIGFIALGLVKMVRILLNASSIFEGIKEIFDSIVALIKSIFTSGDVSTEVDNVSNAASNLKNVFQGLIDKFKEACENYNAAIDLCKDYSGLATLKRRLEAAVNEVIDKPKSTSTTDMDNFSESYSLYLTKLEVVERESAAITKDINYSIVSIF
jgi:tape measure domain-containing protein